MYKQQMQDEFDSCLVLNTRMAARAVTRRADRKLRPFGVTAAQFTILVSLLSRPGRSVTEMANGIAMDRTTLSRNLDLLTRKGIVVAEHAERGNGRLCSLSAEGRALVEQMVPVWRAAQAELRETLNKPDFPTVIAALRHLAKL